MLLAHRGEELGTSQRPVVPIIPTRTVPETSSRMAATSETMASSSPIMRRPRPTTTRPSAVSRPEERSTRTTSSSRFESGHVGGHIRLDRADGDGGGEKLPWSAMPISAWRCLRSKGGSALLSNRS